MDNNSEDIADDQNNADDSGIADQDQVEEYDPTDPGIDEADIVQSIPLGSDGDGIRPDFSFKDHSKQVFSVEILGSEIFCSGGEDDWFRAWKQDGSSVKSVQFDDSVTCILANSKKTKLAVASMDGAVKVFSVPDFTELMNVEPIGDLECIDWHPNADILIAGTAEGQIWMWLVAGNPSTKIVPGFSSAIASAGFLPDGKHVIAGYKDGTGRIWNMKSLTGFPLDPGQAAVTSHAVAKSVEAVALGYEDGIIGLFHHSGKFLATFRHENDVEEDPVSTESLDFSPAFPCLASGHLDASVAVWDLNTSQRRQTMEHDESVVKVRFSGPHELLTCSLDGTARLWDVRSGAAVKTWVADGEILDFAFDEKFLLLGGNQCDLFNVALA